MITPPLGTAGLQAQPYPRWEGGVYLLEFLITQDPNSVY